MEKERPETMLDSAKMLEYTNPVQADLDEFDRKLADYMRGDTVLQAEALVFFADGHYI